MNIWYISKYASPVSRHFHLAKEWIKQGHRTYVITANSHHKFGILHKFKGKFQLVTQPDINVVYLKTYESKKAGGWERIKSWFHFEWQLLTFSKKKLSKPDVVIISSLSLLTVLNAYYFSKKYKAKFIFEVRDIWPKSAMVLGGYSKNHPFMALLARIEKFGYKKADAIVGTIPNLTEHVSSLIGKQNKTHCIPQGLSLEFYENSLQLDQNYIEKYIPKDKFIIAYAGTLNANNPMGTLLDAAERLKDKENIHFMLVGSGYEKDKLIKQAENLKNVSFPPVVKKEQVNHLLSLVDVCYDAFESSLAKYGLSRNKWIDYMYAGKPIICSYSGYQSMINEAQSGKFVPFGDTDQLVKEILYYYNMDKKEIEAEGKRGKRFLISNRTFDILANRYLKIMTDK